MTDNALKLVEYVKLNKTGEILKFKSYDPESQVVEMELPVGAVIAVSRHEVGTITAIEEAEFLSKEKNHANIPL